MTARTKTSAALALALSLAAGCSSHDNKRHVPSASHSSRSDLPAGGAYDDRGLRGIPRDAVRLEKDEGPEMRVRPNQEGRIFLYDPRADRIAYEGRLKTHEEFVAIPDRDSVTIDGRRIESARLDRKARYQLYFLRD
jgi:hypothetical protein